MEFKEEQDKISRFNSIYGCNFIAKLSIKDIYGKKKPFQILLIHINKLLLLTQKYYLRK